MNVVRVACPCLLEMRSGSDDHFALRIQLSNFERGSTGVGWMRLSSDVISSCAYSGLVHCMAASSSRRSIMRCDCFGQPHEVTAGPTIGPMAGKGLPIGITIIR